MPVTARLSKHFYDRLGEQVANELVEWFNQVDTQYRSDLRELNEQNFARFDAKVEQRFAEERLWIEKRFAELEARFEKRMSALEGQFALLREEMGRRFAEQDARIAQQFASQTRFLYVSLVTQLALIAGLYLR